MRIGSAGEWDMNYVAYHVHTDLSLLDSCTKFADYVDRAVELGQKAIAFTEHGNIFNWIAKKMYCDQKGIKYLHGVECYLTETHAEKVRDNMHTILIAKNHAGLLELNSLISRSYEASHFYFKNRLSLDEFFEISGNIIKISACLSSPLNRLPFSHPAYDRLVRRYDYLEIQPHVNSEDQKDFNRHLSQLSRKFGIPLIAGTDTHSLNKYKAECRGILQAAKHIEYSGESEFDLTYKSYGELADMFRDQGALPQKEYLEAMANTSAMADSVEEFELDSSFKYPKLYGSKDKEIFERLVMKGFNDKVASGVIPEDQVDGFKENIPEELRVLDKIEMSGFMLFMSELVSWCKENDIPVGFNRGSCGGSRVAYAAGITDLNPERWKTVFSRFCNEFRKEIGDIDIDVSPDDRDKVYEYIINRFGSEYAAFILAIGTISEKGTVNEILRGMEIRWNRENTLKSEKELKSRISKLKKECGAAEEVDALSAELESIKNYNEEMMSKNPWIRKSEEVKQLYGRDPEEARKRYPEVFYYYDGLLNTAVSQSIHPAGIVASPITLEDNYGRFVSRDKTILQIDMECIHEVSLVKYDILGLKNIQIIKDTYKLLEKPYPLSHEIDWDDESVWSGMLESPVGVFQFEKEYAHSLLRQYKPKSIFDMSMITAAMRPSGVSYRDRLIRRIPNENPSPLIDELLKDNNGYLIYQEDTIKFLQQVCGLTGSEADNVRRAIGRKDRERLEEALPQILDGYCGKSAQPRDVAEQEAKAFLQIIDDSAEYQFGYNHSIGYCMIGYLCAYLRRYHPGEFITAYLNNAHDEEDVKNGSELADMLNIKIVPPAFGLSKDRYVFDRAKGVIAKGLGSIKFISADAANGLYALAQEGKPNSFVELLLLMEERARLNSRQRDILIKVGYFSEYGNAAELLQMVEVFSFFNNGKMKKIQKEKLPSEELYNIVAAHSSDKSKNGEALKTFTITDMAAILIECEEYVKSTGLPDFSVKERIKAQLEYMGHVDLTTGDESDRRKLLVMDVHPMKSQFKDEVWGYVVETRSIGTGKTARLTVKADVYGRTPLHQFDVVLAKSVRKNDKGYWYLNNYERVV
jgi:DNA polymerase-3 subunit alpha